MMSDDMELVREYALTNSQRAFDVLVSRHLNLVYSSALRQVRDTHLAEEVAQAVFIILARKAGSLDPRISLSGWLYRTARYVAADAIKIQRRRQKHEQEAHMRSILINDQTETIWEKMLPLLDEAMAQLRDKDRDVVILRFFENKSLREVGEVLGLEERTAQKRIHRAVEKLRIYFGKRGVASTAAIITGLVSANSVQAAPTALAKTISIAAMGKGAAVGSSTLALAQGAVNTMAWTKWKTAFLMATALMIGVSTAFVAVKGGIFAKEDQSIWTTSRIDLLPPLLILRPARGNSESGAIHQGASANNSDFQRIVYAVLMPEGNRALVSRPGDMKASAGPFRFADKVRGQNEPVINLIAAAYDFSPHRIDLSIPVPNVNYDFISTQPNAREALQLEIQKELKLLGRPETRAVDCLLLQIDNQNSMGFKATADTDKFTGMFFPDEAVVSGYSMKEWCAELENILGQPVIDQTKIDGKFDLRLKWNPQDKSPAAINLALRSQLGLELIPSRENVKILRVEKTK